MKLGRNGLATTDPVTVANFVQQFEHLKTGLDNRLLDDENFIASGVSKTRNIVDAITDSKLFEGRYLSTDTEYPGEPCYELKLAIDKVTELLEEDYIVVSKAFEFSLSTRGANLVDRPISGSDIGTGLATIGGLTASGAAIGSVIPGVGTAIGAGVGAAVGLATVAATWIWGGKEKREKGKDAYELNQLAVEVPFGFVYEEHSVTGTHTASIGSSESVSPIIMKVGTDSQNLYFQVTSVNNATFTTDEFYYFNGKLQILLKRKL